MTADSPANDLTLDDWRKWHALQHSVQGSQAHKSFDAGQDKTGFIFGIRLCQPDESKESDWRLAYIVSAAHDPSLQVRLGDWWELPRDRKTEWQRYFGRQFERNLLVSMGHAARMCQLLWQGMETSRPAELEMDLETAYQFLKNDAPVLQSTGFRVLLPSWWTPKGRQRARLRVKASGRSTQSGASQASTGYFGLDTVVRYEYELSVGGETVSPEEWQELVNAKSSLVRFRGEWMEIDSDQMAWTLAMWQQQEDGHDISIGGLLRDVTERDEDTTEFAFDEVLEGILSRLERKRSIQPLNDPRGLRWQLRAYQKDGVTWLSTMESLGLNPCLADDMGLGKTIQVIALLLHEREHVGDMQGIHPTLLVAPTSVLGNWQMEIGRFAPQLESMIHHGSDRVTTAAEFRRACKGNDILITSFTIARKDSALLKQQEWQRIVVDEAQNIKNPKSAQTRAICSIEAPHRLALTGTPVENRLMDLWSLFNYLNPGFLGSQTQFRKAYETPVQRDRDTSKARQLQKTGPSIHPPSNEDRPRHHQ